MTETLAPIVKHKVTMVNSIAVSENEVHKHVAVDYVPLEQLEEYVADAKTRWQFVTVDAEPDHGPGGPEYVGEE